jgi:uncharacterized protein (DUF302 family)
MSTNQLIIEQVSPFNVEITIKKLLASAIQKEWQNPAIHNLQQSLAKSGKVVRPVQVIEICKPEFSGKMLEKNHERIVSVMMPCRISVYEKDDGKAYVALINSSEMLKDMPDTIAAVMKEAADETIEIVKSVIGPF